MALTLILGGMRSGKTGYAEGLAKRSERWADRPVTYIATAKAGDAEMQDRVTRHREARPKHWLTHEEPLRLAAAIDQCAAKRQQTILVDCLTTWMSNLYFSDGQDYPIDQPVKPPKLLAEEREAFLKAILEADMRNHNLILISNEIGLGGVPITTLGRAYTDELGWLNQRVAVQADNVVMMVAGYPMTVKSA